jgi:hypothetical protein
VKDGGEERDDVRDAPDARDDFRDGDRVADVRHGVGAFAHLSAVLVRGKVDSGEKAGYL